MAGDVEEMGEEVESDYRHYTYARLLEDVPRTNSWWLVRRFQHNGSAGRVAKRLRDGGMRLPEGTEAGDWEWHVVSSRKGGRSGTSELWVRWNE